MSTEPLNTKNILIIDDSDFDLSDLREIMTLFSYNHDIDKNFDISCAKIEEKKYDMVILDLATKDNPVAGLQIIKKLKQIEKNIPILVFTENTKTARLELSEYINKLQIGVIEKGSDQYSISNEIKNLFDLHECNDLRINQFPDLKRELEALKKETFKKSLTEIFLGYLKSDIGKIAATIGTVISAILAAKFGFKIN